MADRHPPRIVSVPVDLDAMEHKRGLAAKEMGRALKRANSAVDNAQTHYEIPPWAVLAAWMLGLVMGAIFVGVVW